MNEPRRFHAQILKAAKKALNERFCYWCNRYHPEDHFGENKKRCKKAQEIIAARMKK
jgi:hypothetical protein